MIRWVIVKGRGAEANPRRPWQLWMANGVPCSLVAERSSHAFCVKVMVRLMEET